MPDLTETKKGKHFFYFKLQIKNNVKLIKQTK